MGKCDAKRRIKVRWVRFRSAAALVKSFRVGIAKAAGFRASDIETDPGMARAVARNRMWAYVDTTPKIPVVRYWHDPSVSKVRLAMMLGHELGHATGKQKRSALAEEDRADEYGMVAAAVWRRLSQR